MSIGTEQGEVLIPTIADNGALMTDAQAVEQYRRTGRHLGIFRNAADADAYAERLHEDQAREYVKPRPRPVEDGRAAALSVYPHAEITDNARDPKSALGRANPGSWHNQHAAPGKSPAIDIRPIPGMTFAQYIQGYRHAGYDIIEQRDEVNHPSAHATGPHWHVVLGQKR